MCYERIWCVCVCVCVFCAGTAFMKVLAVSAPLLTTTPSQSTLTPHPHTNPHTTPLYTPSPSQIVQSNGVAQDSYQQSGYNSVAADGYGNDSTMSPTTPTDEMPTWDDWEEEDQTQDYVNGPTSTGKPGAGGGTRGTTTRGGIDDTCECASGRDMPWGGGGGEG